MKFQTQKKSCIKSINSQTVKNLFKILLFLIPELILHLKKEVVVCLLQPLSSFRSYVASLIKDKNIEEKPKK